MIFKFSSWFSLGSTLPCLWGGRLPSFVIYRTGHTGIKACVFPMQFPLKAAFTRNQNGVEEKPVTNIVHFDIIIKSPHLVRN